MSRTHCHLKWVAVLIALLTASAVAQAADLHFIALSETLDTNIGTQQDLELATSWANAIAANTGLDLKLHTLSGDKLTTGNTRQLLNAISPGQDDVVVFIYTGHGANSGYSDWPTLTFLTYTGEPYVSFDEIVEILQPKQQRMLLVLTDCCNASPYDIGHPVPQLDPSGASAQTIANYQRLFLDFRGTILATAAKTGQFSLGGSEVGGLFFNAFYYDLNSLAESSSNLTWNTVLTAAGTDAKAVADEFIKEGSLGDIEPQEAYFVIDEEQVAASEPDVPDTTTGGTSDAPDGDSPSAGAGCGAVGPGMFALSAACWGAMLVCRRTRRTIA